MHPRTVSLYGNKPLRTFVGVVSVLTVLVVFTEITLRTTVPLAVILSALMIHEFVDEGYDLPEGTNWLVYGTSVFVAGAYWAVISPTPSVGGFLALAGFWFIVDGVTTMQYEPSQTEHGYADLDSDNMGEMMLRMQTLNVVYQALRDASEPQTVTELATDLDLTESRIKSALGFLEHEGHVEQIANQYRAEPPRWGRLNPIVQFLVWLPRRVVRPFHRLAANAYA